MKKIIILLSLLIFSNISNAEKELRVPAFKAPFHVGQPVMVCGKLAQVSAQKKRTFLNLDKKYPNQTLAILIWNNDMPRFIDRFGNLNQFVGRNFCARGIIQQYRHSLEMTVKNPQFLRLMNN